MSRFQITDAQVRDFHRDGYVIVRGLFKPDEMDLLLKIAKTDRDMDKAVARPDSKGYISRLRLRFELYDDVYSAIVRCERVVRTTEKLLGDEVRHFHHKMMLKEPKVGGAWEWHQDYGYWYHYQNFLYPDLLSCAIAVDRANKANGCMQLLKGTHLCGRIEHSHGEGQQTGADLERVEALSKRCELVYAEMDPGDALFFHANTLHRSDQNRSEHPRWTLICCYNARHNEPFKPAPGHESIHTPLDVLPDDQVLAVARRQWQDMQKNLQTV